MFPKRMFAGRYFPARYFPPAAAEAPTRQSARTGRVGRTAPMPSATRATGNGPASVARTAGPSSAARAAD